MRRSFYHYMMTHRFEVTSSGDLAEAIFLDVAFPKQATNYQEISNYLELSVDYPVDFQLLDALWQDYLETD